MAIKGSENPATEQNNQAEQANVRQTRSLSAFGGSGTVFGSPISKGIGSEHMSKLKESLVEIYKEANGDAEISVLPFDRGDYPAFAFSCLVVAARFSKDKASAIAYHTLIIEASGEEVTPYFDTINGKQIDIFRSTSNAYDKILVGEIDRGVQNFFGGANVINVDSTVVPRDFNINDKELLRNLAVNTALACCTELEINRPDFKDMNLAEVKNDNSLIVSTTFAKQQTHDVVGNAMRSDIIVDFASRRNQNQRNISINNGDKETIISRVNAYLDLVWAPDQQNMAFNNNQFMHPGMGPQHRYTPRLIITNISSAHAYTPATILLSLATVISVKDRNNWMNAFRPQITGSKDIDLSDVGYLNVDANLENNTSKDAGDRINTKSENFKLPDLFNYLTAMIRPGLIVSLDCPESSPQSWYTGIFAAADSGSKAAERQIIAAANELTNGAFSRYFPDGSQMFVDNNNVIYLGHWYDRSGNKRDIRDFDHLAACVIYETNPKIIRDFSDTYLKTEYPLEERMSARKKLISNMSGETAKFTGKARRVTFTTQFIDALVQGIRDTNINITTNTMQTGDQFNQQRGSAGWAQSALITGGNTFLAQGGQQYQQNTAFYNIGQYRF